jgi:hypothetical protein
MAASRLAAAGSPPAAPGASEARTAESKGPPENAIGEAAKAMMHLTG